MASTALGCRRSRGFHTCVCNTVLLKCLTRHADLYPSLDTCRWLLTLAVTAASLGGAAAQAQPCSTSFTVALRNFNKAGTGPAGNPDFGFLPEPANINDRKIVKAVLPAAGQPAYRPATGFNTTTTHSERCQR
jgi:hypothetical protein